MKKKNSRKKTKQRKKIDLNSKKQRRCSVYPRFAVRYATNIQNIQEQDIDKFTHINFCAFQCRVTKRWVSFVYKFKKFCIHIFLYIHFQPRHLEGREERKKVFISEGCEWVWSLCLARRWKRQFFTPNLITLGITFTGNFKLSFRLGSPSNWRVSSSYSQLLNYCMKWNKMGT